MFEFDWKLNKSVFRNLLRIRGISHTTAIKLCALLGISKKIKYSELSSHKLDQLQLLLSYYSKKSKVFSLNSLSDLNGSQRIAPSFGGQEPSVISPILATTGEQSKITETIKPSLGKWSHVWVDTNQRWLGQPSVMLSQNMQHNPIMNSLDVLKRENILSLINLNTYRGRRFKFGYPVKGQRTRTNANTARKLNRIKY